MDLFNLKGKTALVTGGTKGIGKGIAVGLAQAGANIIVSARTEIKETLQEIESCDVECQFIKFDFSETDRLNTYVKEVLDKAGQIDILVNNAGLQIRHPAVEFPEKDWKFLLSVNLDSVFFLCQKLGEPMLKRGYGKIINIASVSSFQGGINVSAYAASKGAVMQFSKTLANEWAKSGVNVNCIVPGYIDTDLNDALLADEVRNRQILERIPAGRWGKDSDFAGTAVFLASRASDYVHGTFVAVDGGWLAR